MSDRRVVAFDLAVHESTFSRPAPFAWFLSASDRPEPVEIRGWALIEDDGQPVVEPLIASPDGRLVSAHSQPGFLGVGAFLAGPDRVKTWGSRAAALVRARKAARAERMAERLAEVEAPIEAAPSLSTFGSGRGEA